MEKEIHDLIENMKTTWYDWLYDNEPDFKNLGLDERAKYVNCVITSILSMEGKFSELEIRGLLGACYHE
jgi:hypothetical protein